MYYSARVSNGATDCPLCIFKIYVFTSDNYRSGIRCHQVKGYYVRRGTICPIDAEGPHADIAINHSIRKQNYVFCAFDSCRTLHINEVSNRNKQQLSLNKNNARCSWRCVSRLTEHAPRVRVCPGRDEGIIWGGGGGGVYGSHLPTDFSQ